MRGNSHVRFLGGGAAVMPSCYPTKAARKSWSHQFTQPGHHVPVRGWCPFVLFKEAP